MCVVDAKPIAWLAEVILLRGLMALHLFFFSRNSIHSGLNGAVLPLNPATCMFCFDSGASAANLCAYVSTSLFYVCLRLILEITVSIYVKRRGCYPCNRKRVKGLTLCVCVCVCVGSYVRWSALVKWSISQSMIPYKCLVTSDTYGTICILIELIRLHVGGIMEAQRCLPSWWEKRIPSESSIFCVCQNVLISSPRL